MGERIQTKIAHLPLRVFITAILVVLFLLPKPDCLTQVAPLWLAASIHHLWHVNVFHLLANLLCIWTMPIGKRVCADWIPAYLIATISYAIIGKATIGFSNILFALAGMRVSKYMSIKHFWANNSNRIFIITMVAMAVIPYFSAVTHILSFVMGLAFALARTEIHKVKELYERSTHR